MTVERKRNIYILAFALVALGVSFSFASLTTVSATPDAEITIVARDMAFYIEGDPTPNPPLELTAGSRTRVTFINYERGVQHDLKFPELGLQTGLLNGDGSKAQLDILVPVGQSDSTYTCSLHVMMMTGAVTIR